MNIFIAGAKVIRCLDEAVIQKLDSIYQKGYDVLVGDCDGVVKLFKSHCLCQ